MIKNSVPYFMDSPYDDQRVVQKLNHLRVYKLDRDGLSVVPSFV